MDSASGGLWPIITFVGPVLLAAVILWAMLRNRLSKARDIQRTEDATSKLYDQEEAARKVEEDDQA